MKCVVCKQAETRPGTATVTLERDGLTVVFKGVPAQVCPNCGEDYVEQAIADRKLLRNGPVHYAVTPLPGVGDPFAVAGHRTTYGEQAGVA
mgnify:CR=1 FL=1